MGEVFDSCASLVFVKLSRNLECIGCWAFSSCKYLTSIFIPPSCQEIYYGAFMYCKKLIIFHVPQHAQLGDEENVIMHTALLEVSPFVKDYHGNDAATGDWIVWHKDSPGPRVYDRGIPGGR